MVFLTAVAARYLFKIEDPLALDAGSAVMFMVYLLWRRYGAR